MSGQLNTARKAAHIIGQIPDFTRVVLYGSRAIGTWTEKSDIDLAAITPNIALIAANMPTLRKIYSMLNGENIETGDGPGQVNVFLMTEGEFEHPERSSSPDILGTIKSQARQLYP